MTPVAGTTYLYETKSAWVVCDDSTAVPGGPRSERGYTPTLVSSHLKSGSYQPDTSTLAISENWLSKPNSGWPASTFRFAAGRDFDGVQAISYTFPDNHTAQAVVGQNGLWSRTYLPTDGILTDQKTNTFNLDPIEVTVDYTGRETETFTLRWGLDTCAQLNHGC